MKRFILAALLAPAALLAQVAAVAPANAPARITIGPRGEAGDPLVISGTVFKEDGKTPIPNASVYVYQTDAKGAYSLDDARASNNPRLRGYLRTDAQGRYEFRTIRPGSYPGTRNPGHIHYHVNAPGYRERVFEIVFDGDTLIPEQWKRDATNPQSGVAIVKLESGSDARRGTQNVILRP
jgi:protocatechuate 3,4-dioxygenase beta subunit